MEMNHSTDKDSMDIDTHVIAQGMRFYLQWEESTKQAKIYGPMADGYAWEGPLVLQIKSNEWYSALKQAEKMLEEMKFA